MKAWVNRLHRTTTERSIEGPWAQKAINACRGTWLDLGFTWTEPDFWEGVNFKGTLSVGLDIAPPFRSHPFDETIMADVCEYGLVPFDLITCISTLEHIGCDNNRYKAGEYRRDDPVAIQRAVVEKLRRNADRLLVSVPFGRFQDHGWFIQYDRRMVEELEPTTVSFHGLDGQDSLDNCIYHTDEMRAAAVALLEWEAL